MQRIRNIDIQPRLDLLDLPFVKQLISLGFDLFNPLILEINFSKKAKGFHLVHPLPFIEAFSKPRPSVAIFSRGDLWAFDFRAWAQFLGLESLNVSHSWAHLNVGGRTA